MFCHAMSWSAPSLVLCPGGGGVGGPAPLQGRLRDSHICFRWLCIACSRPSPRPPSRGPALVFAAAASGSPCSPPVAAASGAMDGPPPSRGDESGRSAAWPGQRAHRAHFETRCVHPVAKGAGTLRRCHEVSCCVMRCHVPPRRALSADLLEAPVVCILHVVPPSRFVPFAPPPACLRRVPVSRVSHGRARPRLRRRGSRA